MANQRQLIVLDNDDFYTMTADLVLFNLGQPSSIKVQTKPEYESFLKSLESKKFTKAVYIVDEFFGNGKVDVAELLKNIRLNDADAYIICYTVSEPEEVENKDSYNSIVLKTSRELDKSLIKTLSEVYGVEFVADNSDPERDSKSSY